MTVVLAWEPIARLLDDGLADLVKAHHEEVGVHKEQMPLDVNWELYRQQESAGIMRVLAARDDDKLIGYNSFTVVRHLHYWSTLHALGDAIYVAQDKRHTGAGIALIDRAEHDLREDAKPGYVRIVYHDKAFLNYLGPILGKRGYEHQENIWSKITRAE